MLTIVCWKWKNRGWHRPRIEYTAEHVNIFASMVRRNLAMPHRILCITDDPDGIDPSIETYPIWEDKGALDIGGCFVRLRAFSAEQEIMDLLGDRYVNIDLDCVITGQLDPLFEPYMDEDLVLLLSTGKHTPYWGSMWMNKTGTYPHIWNDFKSEDLLWYTKSSGKGGFYTHPEAVRKGFVVGSDQAWISACVYPDVPIWTEEDGIYSYRLLRMPRIISIPRWKKEQKSRRKIRVSKQVEVDGWGGKLPPDAKIIFFNGTGDPSLKNCREECPWINEYWI